MQEAESSVRKGHRVRRSASPLLIDLARGVFRINNCEFKLQTADYRFLLSSTLLYPVSEGRTSCIVVGL